MSAHWLSLLIAAGLFAQVMPAHRREAARLPAVAGGCATTDTSLPHDELLEGWQGASEENTWADGGGSDYVTIDDDYDSSGLTTDKPDGACDETFHCVISSGGAAAEYKVWDRGSALSYSTTSDFVFYLYLESANVTTSSFGFLSAGAGANPVSLRQWYTTLTSASGNIKIQATGTSTTSTVGTNGTLATGQWYKIAIHNEGTAANSTMTINDWTPLGFTRADNDIRYVQAGGCVNVTTGDEATFNLDVLAWNTP